MNVSSRYESTTEPNDIHVSDAVRVRLDDDFVFEDAGDIEIKGKGKMRSWVLIGAKGERGQVIPLKGRRQG